jgi:hypothetical protein
VEKKKDEIDFIYSKGRNVINDAKKQEALYAHVSSTGCYM